MSHTQHVLAVRQYATMCIHENREPVIYDSNHTFAGAATPGVLPRIPFRKRNEAVFGFVCRQSLHDHKLLSVQSVSPTIDATFSRMLV